MFNYQDLKCKILFSFFGLEFSHLQIPSHHQALPFHTEPTNHVNLLKVKVDPFRSQNITLFGKHYPHYACMSSQTSAISQW